MLQEGNKYLDNYKALNITSLHQLISIVLRIESCLSALLPKYNLKFCQ